MTTQTTAPAPLTTPRALAALQDAIRAELIARLSDELESMLGTEDEQYLDGWRDAITTLTKG